VGEGSDELFAGYEYWKMLYRWSGRKDLVRLLSRLVGRGSPDHLTEKLYAKFHWYLRGSLPPYELLRKALQGEEFFWGGAVVATDQEKRASVFSQEFLREADGRSSYRIVERLYHEARQRDPAPDILAEWALVDLSLRLPELLLMRVDKMGMAASIEGRVPFLDHKLVQCALSIPARWKIRNGTTKYILKKVAEGILPRHLIYRKKVGFPSPVHSWMHEGLLGIMEDRIFRSPLVGLRILDYPALQAQCSQFRRTGRANFGVLWLALNLTLWYDRWVA